MPFFGHMLRVLPPLFLICVATPLSAQTTQFEIDPESAFARFLFATEDVAEDKDVLEMGYVDGVHIAILAIDGRVGDQSPVVYVSPMDSDDLMVLAPSFLEFLADGSGVNPQRIEGLLETADSDPAPLLDLLRLRFDTDRLLSEERVETLNERYIHLAERKSDCELLKREHMRSLFSDMSEDEYDRQVREHCDGGGKDAP